MVQQEFTWKQKPHNDQRHTNDVRINDGRLFRQKALGDGVVTVGQCNLQATHPITAACII